MPLREEKRQGYLCMTRPMSLYKGRYALQAVRERKDVLHGSTTRYQSIKRLGLVEVMVITEYKYKYFVPFETMGLSEVHL